MVFGVKKKKRAAAKPAKQSTPESGNTPVGGIAKANTAKNGFKAPSTPVKRPQIIGRGQTG